MMTLVNASNPYEVAFSWMFDALHRLGLREYEQAEASAARALNLAEKHQIPQPAAYTRFALGQARAQLGRTTEGIALIRQGLAAMLEVGMRLTVPYVIAGHWRRHRNAKALIADALETVEQALQAYLQEPFRPAARQLRGELRLRQRQTESAESDFRESIALAQKMRAKHPELRSTVESRTTARDSQGNRDEARAMLAEIYNWFTEGFDTADLKDAKALLDELSG